MKFYSRHRKADKTPQTLSHDIQKFRILWLYVEKRSIKLHKYKNNRFKKELIIQYANDKFDKLFKEA